MTEALHRRVYENLFESGENFGAWIWMCYEEAAACDPSVSFIEFSLVFGFFKFLIVAVQDLDMEFVCFFEVVQDSGDDVFVVIFANAEAVFAVA